MKKTANIIIILICTIGMMSVFCIQKRVAEAPVAKKTIETHELHGVTWEDNYGWLENRNSEDVLEYLKAENVYTKAMTAENEQLQTTIYNEIIAKIKETDESVPEKNGDYYYYSKTEKGKDYNIYCRKKGSLDSDEDIILDLNILAEGKDYYSVDMLEVSPNGKMLAYAVDTSGREEYTIYFKDLKNNKVLKDNIKRCYNSLVWASDNKTVFYTVLDETLRPYRVYRHTLNSKTEDELVYEEPDGKFWMELSVSKSKKYLFINSASSMTSEVRYLKSNKENDDFHLFQERIYGMEYSVYHHDDYFFVVTNDNATNFKIEITPTNKTQKKNWVDFFPYDESVKIDGLDMFKDYIVVYERKGGNKQVRVVKLKDRSAHYLDFGEDVYTYSRWDNYNFKSKEVRLTFNSPITPKIVFDYNMDTKEKSVLKEYKIPNYDKSLYETKRDFVETSAGVKIPISLVYKKGLRQDGTNPVYLYGYGSYGSSTEARFRPYLFPLLDRGVIYCIAHVRGGGEMGRTWYEDGKFFKKKNTFTDFIDAAEYLVKEKYTTAEMIAGSGGSAGGLLIGAVANMRPDLFKVLVADVPFVDLINTMLDPSIPLTVMEYEEWGNPNEKEYFDYMMSYSPYDNVTNQNYPDMLITAGFNDPRVQYFEPAKWTAKLRDMKTNSNILLLKTNMGAGHMGSSGRYQFYDELAFEFAFVLNRLGIEE